jgi:hypothetical protein
MKYLIQYDADWGFLSSGVSDDARNQGLGWWRFGRRFDRRRIGKWRIGCWLGGYGVGVGRVFMANGRG